MSLPRPLPRSLPRTLAHPSRLAVVMLTAFALLLAACDGTNATDGGEDAPTTTPTSTPTVTSTDVPPTGGSAGDAAGGAAGGGIEPANPEAPPMGVLNSGSGNVPLGLGTYCWSPPTGSGRMGMCVDKIGIITTADDLMVLPGEHLTVTGDEITLPPMTIAYAYLYPAPAEPVVEEGDVRAWTPGSMSEQALEFGDDVLTLPDDLAPGRYLLAVNYTAGPDRGSEATYGAILVVEQAVE